MMTGLSSLHPLIALALGCSVLFVTGQEVENSRYCQSPPDCSTSNVTARWPMRDNCRRFYRCNGAGKWKSRNCGQQKHFDISTMRCRNPTRAVCLSCNYADATDPACSRPSTCQSNDRLPDPENCLRFYVCTNNRWVIRDCAPGTKYDKSRSRCDHITNMAVVCQLPCPDLAMETPTTSNVSVQQEREVTPTTSLPTTPVPREVDRRLECNLGSLPCTTGTLLPYPGDCNAFQLCINGAWHKGNCRNKSFDSATKTCRLPPVVCSPPCRGVSTTQGTTTTTSTTTTATTTTTTTTPEPQSPIAKCKDITQTMPLEELCNATHRTDHSSCKFEGGVVLVHTHPDNCRQYFVCAGANFWGSGACAPRYRYDPATCSCKPQSEVTCNLRCHPPSSTSPTTPTTTTTTTSTTTPLSTSSTTSWQTTAETTSSTTTAPATSSSTTTTTSTTYTAPTTSSRTTTPEVTSRTPEPDVSFSLTSRATTSSTLTFPPSTTTSQPTTSSSTTSVVQPTSPTTSAATFTPKETTTTVSTPSKTSPSSLSSSTATTTMTPTTRTTEGSTTTPSTTTGATATVTAATSSVSSGPSTGSTPGATATGTTTWTTGRLLVVATSAGPAWFTTPNTSADSSSPPPTPPTSLHPAVENATKSTPQVTRMPDAVSPSVTGSSTTEVVPTSDDQPTDIDVTMSDSTTGSLTSQGGTSPAATTDTLTVSYTTETTLTDITSSTFRPTPVGRLDGPDTTTDISHLTTSETSHKTSQPFTSEPTSEAAVTLTVHQSTAYLTSPDTTSPPASSPAVTLSTDEQTVSLPWQTTTLNQTSRPAHPLPDAPSSGRPTASTSMAPSLVTTNVLEFENTGDMTSTTSFPLTTALDLPTLCMSEVREGVDWPDTPRGRTHHRKCPGGRKGNISRTCRFRPGVGAQWDKPDGRFCVDVRYQQLMQEVDSLSNQRDDPMGSQNSGMKASAQLNRLTATETVRPRGIQPGNLNASVHIFDMLTTLATNNTSMDNVELDILTGAASNMLSLKNENGWNTLQERDPSRSVSLMSSVDRIGEAAALSMPPGQRIIEAQNLQIRVEVIPKEDATQLEFAPPNQHGRDTGPSMHDRVMLEKATVDALGEMVPGDNLAIWSTHFQTLHQLLPVEDDDMINSNIISVSVKSLPDGTNLSPPIKLQFSSLNTSATSYEAECSFWQFADTENEFNGGRWSDMGCETVFSNSTTTLCACNHLTNFAVLLSPHQATGLHATILTIISVVGCLISILGMIATICLYIVSWKRIKSHHAAVLINLCVALILANVTFLAGIDRTETKMVCTVVAALLHFFYLAAFFIMFAEGIQFILYVVQVFHVRRKRETLLLLITSWILPGVIVGVTMSITRGEGYGTEDYCWLRKDTGLIAAFAVPAMAVIIGNFVILCKILHTIANSKGSEKTNRVKATIWNIAVMMPLLGLTWVFGLFSVSEATISFQYIFAVCNSLQGFFIFFFHCALNKKMREAVAERFSSRYSQNSSLRKSGGWKSNKSQKKKGDDKPFNKKSTQKKKMGKRTQKEMESLNHQSHYPRITMEQQTPFNPMETPNTYDQTNFTDPMHNFNYSMSPTATKKPCHYQQNSPKVTGKDPNRKKSNQLNHQRRSETSEGSRSSLYNYKYNTKEKGNAYIVFEPEYMEIGPTTPPVDEEGIYMSIDNITHPSSQYTLRPEDDCQSGLA